MPGQVSDFWGFEPPILAVVPATLPLSYALKPKSLARKVSIRNLRLRGMIQIDRYWFNEDPEATELSELRKFVKKRGKFGQVMGYSSTGLFPSSGMLNHTTRCFSAEQPSMDQPLWLHIS